MARLAEAVAKIPAGRHGPECPLKVLSDVLPKAEAADLRVLLANTGVTARQIRGGLAKIGHPREAHFDQAIRKHRRGDCGCAR